MILSPESLDGYLGTFLPYLSKTLNSASAYAQQCYSNDTLAQVCSIYVQPHLPITIDRNISCPFPGANICHKAFGNLRLDTGLLDSQVHFGINTKPKNRFQYRHVNECAVLRTENYTTLDTSTPFSQTATLSLAYGGLTDESGSTSNNITYQALVSSELLNGTKASYALECVISRTSFMFLTLLATQAIRPLSLMIRASYRFLIYEWRTE